jgi:hypothetical protein
MQNMTTVMGVTTVCEHFLEGAQSSEEANQDIEDGRHITAGCARSEDHASVRALWGI